MAMTCSLSELINSIERSMIPNWVCDEVLKNKPEMIHALTRGQEYTIHGPNGETLTVKASPTKQFLSRIIEWFR